MDDFDKELFYDELDKTYADFDKKFDWSMYQNDNENTGNVNRISATIPEFLKKNIKVSRRSELFKTDIVKGMHTKYE
jgi:hypothetical protein